MLRRLLLVLAMASVTVPLAAESSACPVTSPPNPPFVPPAPYPPSAGPQRFWFGTEALFTPLKLEGAWRGVPRNDGYFNKVFWFRKGFNWRDDDLKPRITVTGRRLDVKGPAFVEYGATHAILDNGNFSAILIGVTVPAEGCWEITGEYRGDKLTFVVQVP